MNCPGCGAAMHVVGNRNHFHCDHCGRYEFPQETGDSVVELHERSLKACPVCRVALEKALVEGEPVRYCTHCRGFMTHLDAFGRIVYKRRALHGPHEQIGEPFDPKELKRVIQCPTCNRKMETHPYFGGGNAVVDTCHHCGWIWLDAGELAIIERFIPHVPRHDPILPLSRDAAPQDMLSPMSVPLPGMEDLL